ncbi:hypothetical protein RRF57_005072 [Xylaria bambusicola]|uniref:Uncharacterized protein n=1 Tax=Xylaria bambusicola TaxID=326684 RepID=A0AAN7Z4F8_9PEZI
MADEGTYSELSIADPFSTRHPNELSTIGQTWKILGGYRVQPAQSIAEPILTFKVLDHVETV